MRWPTVLFVLSATTLFGDDPLYNSARVKLDRLEELKTPRGSVVRFSPGEINAWARVRVPEIIPAGIRSPRVELGVDSGTASALLDLLKMQHAQGRSSGWIVEKLIEGERPVKVAIRIESGGGRCTVFLTRVEISGVVVSGSVLDVLIKNFFLPLYPDAKVDEPFDLGYNIDRIELRPSGVRVTMKK